MGLMVGQNVSLSCSTSEVLTSASNELKSRTNSEELKVAVRYVYHRGFARLRYFGRAVADVVGTISTPTLSILI